MHTLIVTAHPSSKGFTHRIADEYRKVREEHGHTVTLMNLYLPPWRQDFLSFEDEREISSRGKELTPIQEEIRRAEELVFIFPVWWYSVPATLKNFLDQNFTSGFAYVFTKVGSISGLLQPRTARLFSTSGGPSILYRLHLLPYAKTLQKTLSDCGIKIVSKTIFGPRHGADPVKEEQWLQVVRKAAGK